MKLTELSIKNHMTTIILYILVVVGGYMAYTEMEKAEDPGFTIKTATITTYWPGATAEQMERLVSDKIAETLQEMEEIDFIDAKNRDGISTVYFNAEAIYWGDELRPIWEKLRKKVYIEAAPKLPDGVVGPFVNDEFGDVYGTVVAVTGDDYSNTELYNEANKLREVLLMRVPQIGKIKVYGVQDERIFIEYNNARLAEMKISVKDIADALSSRNIIIPGGNILDRTDRMTVLPTGNFTSVDEIGQTVINIPGQDDVVYLKDIATVKKGYIDPATYKAQFNGKPSIMLAISLKAGEDNIKLGRNVKELLATYQDKAPLGLDYNIVAFQPDIVENKVLSFVSNLAQAIFTVLAVMFIFLGLRTGLIVASLVPTAIAIALIMLPKMGYGLNQMTLAGLIIALGMLVDNAIVMSESIMVAMESGKSRMEACLDSAASLKIPLLISSLTTMAAFSPIMMVEETMGEYVGPLSIVVIITLFASWLVAMTLVPMLCHRYLKVEQQEENFETKGYKMYRGLLTKLLRFPKMGLIGVAGMLIIGIGLFSLTKKQFMPDSDKPMMYTIMRLPIGTSIERTESVVDDLNAYIEEKYKVSDELLPTGIIDTLLTGGTTKKYEEEGITSWGAFIGGGAPKYTLIYSPEAPAPEYAYVLYNTTNYKLIPEIAEDIDNYLGDRYPDLEAFSNILSTGNSAEKNIEYRITGTDMEELRVHVEEIKAKLATVPGAANISDNWNQEVRRVVVDVDQDKVRQAGLTSEEVAMSLQSILTGVEATTFRNPSAPPINSLVPVTLRTTSEFRDDVTALETTRIFSARTGETVPLKQIADIKLEWAPGFIYTRDRVFTMNVSATLADDVTSAEIDAAMVPWLDEKIAEWGPEFKWELGGENESSNDNSEALGSKLPIAGLIIVLLLVAQFNSVRKPIVILSSIPLGIIGVSVGLLISGEKFGFMPLVALVSLAGVVINNAIVLLDSIDVQLSDFGRTPQAAVIEACQRRMRPILLTTITTLCGLLPLWFFGGTLFAPLAVALIFGLIFGTTLTLGVVPLFYAVLFKVNFKEYEYIPATESDNR